MKEWKADYKGHIIQVKNTLASEQLIVDGELQDERIGFGIRSRLYGRLKSGQGAGEAIKVSLGGWFAIHCRIFIDDSLVFSG